MSEVAKKKVFSAVRRCLDQCFAAKDPLVLATSYVDHLRCDPHWSPQETEEVESMVFRAMRVIVRSPARGCCDQPAHSPLGT